MAAVANDRDFVLQGTSTRAVLVPENYIVLTAPKTLFKVSEAGVPDSVSVLITAELVGRIYGICTFSLLDGIATIIDNSNNTCTINFASMSSDSIIVRASITYLGVVYTKNISIYKVYDGATGADGLAGLDGADGLRGSVTAYTSGSSWSDASANTAIQAYSGTAYLVAGDTVTISNGSNFAATKYWSGLSWLSPGTVIDGNLLVTGTLTANKIGAGTLSAAVVFGNYFAVNTSGAIHSTGKATYSSNTAGFFLGYDTSAYKLNIGDATNYLKWNGSTLEIKGNLNAASGTFVGTLDTTGYIYARGSTTAGGNTGAIFGETALSGVYGIVGINTYSSTNSGAGILGYGTNCDGLIGNSTGVGKNGVRGTAFGASGYGVSGTSFSASGYGVHCQNLGGGHALFVQGTMSLQDNTGLNADLLDGYHAASFSLTSHNHSGVYAPASHTHDSINNGGYTWSIFGSVQTGGGTANFPGNNKPGSTSTCQWVPVTINGSSYVIPVWTI